MFDRRKYGTYFRPILRCPFLAYKTYLHTYGMHPLNIYPKKLAKRLQVMFYLLPYMNIKFKLSTLTSYSVNPDSF